MSAARAGLSKDQDHLETRHSRAPQVTATAPSEREAGMTHSATRLVALVCISLFLAALCARAVHAQAIHEGKLTGTVTQEDGAVLPGATVDISGPQLLGGKRSAVTSGDGTYLFLNVPKGVYVVTTGLA